MQVQEAIDVLERLKIAGATMNVDGKRILQPVILAIDCLNKANPIKPREHDYYISDLAEEERLGVSQWICKKCDTDLEEHFNYCRECGQKIDWD